MGHLYLVATPIGNLEDITMRALRVLREVPLIAAEDTRTTRKLLAHYDVHARLTSYTEHNKVKKTPAILRSLAAGDVALVSEAGTPAISDPGYDLVVAAHEAGARVVPVPGPSVLTAALAASGLPTRSFTYLGFLPRQRGTLRALLRSLKGRSETLVAFEAPRRIRATLSALLEVLGDRPIAVCRELTKLHEEVFRGRISEAAAHFRQPRGEFTLVIAGAVEELPTPPEEALIDELALLRQEGMTARDAVTRISAEYGLSRRRVYRLWLRAR